MIERARLKDQPEIGIGLRNGEHNDGIIVMVGRKIIAEETWRRRAISKVQLANILRELADKVEAAS